MVRRWIKNKDVYLKAKNKRFRLRLYVERAKEFNEIEQACDREIKELRKKNVNISGKWIRAYSKSVAAELGIDNFKASKGWLHGFLKSKSSFISSF